MTVDKIIGSCMDTIFSIDFLGKEVLYNQYIHSEYTAVFLDESCISVKFTVDSCVERFPYEKRVPVEIFSKQMSGAPIVFLIHVVNGLIHELEIFSADGSKIHTDSLKIDKTDYIIADSLGEGTVSNPDMPWRITEDNMKI